MNDSRIAVMLGDNGKPSGFFAKIAHVSGNQIDVLHCPFCGSGAIVARSDGSINCTFCNAAFTVTVSPVYPAFPMSVGGQPYPWPGRPDGGMDPAMMSMDPDQPGGGAAGGGNFGGQLIPGNGGGDDAGDSDNPFVDDDGGDAGDGDSGAADDDGGSDDDTEASVGGKKKPPFGKKKSSRVAYKGQGKHTPDHSEYVGRCQACRTKYCWPKSPVTTHVQNGPGGAQFACPKDDGGTVIQTSRMNSQSDFHHLYEHQVANLQAAAQQKSSLLIYTTSTGGRVAREDMMRHLAIVTARDQAAMAEKIKASRS